MNLFFSTKNKYAESTSNISINSVLIPCTWVAERRKTFSVKWNADAEQFIIKYPIGISQRDRAGFIERHNDQIFKLYNTRIATRHYNDGETLRLFGEIITIRTKIAEKSSVRYNHHNNEIVIAMKEFSQSAIKKALLSVYSKEARRIFTDLVTTHAIRMSVTCNGISIRNQKSRWGSASVSGRLNFNCRLLLAPRDVLEYVVIHELVHLTHMNHSQEFWKTVEAYMPDFRVHRRWLKSHGMQLML